MPLWRTRDRGLKATGEAACCPHGCAISIDFANHITPLLKDVVSNAYVKQLDIAFTEVITLGAWCFTSGSRVRWCQFCLIGRVFLRRNQL